MFEDDEVRLILGGDARAFPGSIRTTIWLHVTQGWPGPVSGTNTLFEEPNQGFCGFRCGSANLFKARLMRLRRGCPSLRAIRSSWRCNSLSKS